MAGVGAAENVSGREADLAKTGMTQEGENFRTGLQQQGENFRSKNAINTNYVQGPNGTYQLSGTNAIPVLGPDGKPFVENTKLNSLNPEALKAALANSQLQVDAKSLTPEARAMIGIAEPQKMSFEDFSSAAKAQNSKLSGDDLKKEYDIWVKKTYGS